MKIRFILFCSVFFIVFFSSFAQADSQVLTVRHLSNGGYEAVINYDTSGSCFVEVSPASSVEIVGFEVTIESPEHAIPPLCLGPILPTEYFEKSAHIGPLAPGYYTVTWTQPRAFNLSTSLRVSDAGIPSSSTWSLSMLILAVLAFAYFALSSKGYFN